MLKWLTVARDITYIVDYMICPHFPSNLLPFTEPSVHAPVT